MSSIGSIRKNDGNQEIPLYKEIFLYQKHGEYRGWILHASKPLYLKNNKAEMTRTAMDYE